MYMDVICQHGASNKTVTNNVQVLAGVRWTEVIHKYGIETVLTVPFHQYQNFCEGQGGNSKLALQKLLHITPHTPLQYW